MAVSLPIKYQGITKEKTQNGIAYTIVYTGTKTQCENAQSSLEIPSTDATFGRLESATVTQDNGPVYNLTLKYTTAGYASGSSVTPPTTVVGEKSRTLDCTILSTPLQQHVNYLMQWDHYLAAKVPIGGTKPAPTDYAWWATADATFTLTAAQAETYAILDSSTVPVEPNSGYTWVIVENPTKPGVTSYDEACYTLTILQRARHWGAGLALSVNKANRIYTNANLGVNTAFVDGTWKCDHADVSWDGEYWIVKLTFTYSRRGWDRVLYPLDGGNI